MELLNEEINLSSKYINLSEMFTDHIIIKCECLLTAFSLNPNPDNYRRIICMVETLGISSNSGTRIKFNPLVIDYSLPKSTQIQKQLLSDECIEIILSGRAFESVTCKETVNRMGQDLVTILSAPRNKLLMWSMPWTELNSNCLSLLSTEKRLEILKLSSINAKNELKFINIDYNEFKHLPVAESPGIEKGYEQYMDSDDDDSDEVQKQVIARKQPKPRKPRKRVNKNDSNIDNLPYFNDPNLKQLAPTLFQIGSNVEVPYDCDNIEINDLLIDEIKLPDPESIVHTDFSTLDQYLNAGKDEMSLLNNKTNKDDDYDDDIELTENKEHTHLRLNSDGLLYNDPLNDHYSYSLRRSFTPPQLSEDFTDISCDSKSEISLQAIEPSLKVTSDICSDLMSDSKPEKPVSMIEIRLATAFIDEPDNTFPTDMIDNEIPCTDMNDSKMDFFETKLDSQVPAKSQKIIMKGVPKPVLESDLLDETLSETKTKDDIAIEIENECSVFDTINLNISQSSTDDLSKIIPQLSSNLERDMCENNPINGNVEPTDVEIEKIFANVNVEPINNLDLDSKIPSPILFAFDTEDDMVEPIAPVVIESELILNRDELNTPEIQNHLELSNEKEAFNNIHTIDENLENTSNIENKETDKMESFQLHEVTENMITDKLENISDAENKESDDMDTDLFGNMTSIENDKCDKIDHDELENTVSVKNKETVEMKSNDSKSLITVDESESENLISTDKIESENVMSADDVESKNLISVEEFKCDNVYSEQIENVPAVVNKECIELNEIKLKNVRSMENIERDNADSAQIKNLDCVEINQSVGFNINPLANETNNENIEYDKINSDKLENVAIIETNERENINFEASENVTNAENGECEIKMEINTLEVANNTANGQCKKIYIDQFENVVSDDNTESGQINTEILKNKTVIEKMECENMVTDKLKKEISTEIEICNNESELNNMIETDNLDKYDCSISFMETMSTPVSPNDQCSACPSMEVSEDEDEKFEISGDFVNNAENKVNGGESNQNESLSCDMEVDVSEIKDSDEYIKTDVYIHKINNSDLELLDACTNPLAGPCPMEELLPNKIDSNTNDNISHQNEMIEIDDYWKINFEKFIHRDDPRIQPIIKLEKWPLINISPCYVKLGRLSVNVIRAHTSPKLILVRKFKEWRIGKPNSIRNVINSNKKLYISLKRLKLPITDYSGYESDESSNYSSSYTSSPYYRPDYRRRALNYPRSSNRDCGYCDRVHLTPITSNGQEEYASLIAKLTKRYLYISLKRMPLLVCPSELSSSRSSLSSNSSNLEEIETKINFTGDNSITLRKTNMNSNAFKWQISRSFRTYARAVMINNENFQEEGSRESRYSFKYYTKRCAAPASENKAIQSTFVFENNKTLSPNRGHRRILHDLNINSSLRRDEKVHSEKVVTSMTMMMKKKLQTKKQQSILDRVPGLNDYNFLKIDSKFRKQIVQVVDVSKKGGNKSEINIDQSDKPSVSASIIQLPQNSHLNTISFASPIATNTTTTPSAQSNILQFLCRTNGRKIQLTPISKIGDARASPASTTTSVSMIPRNVIKNKPVILNQIGSNSTSSLSSLSTNSVLAQSATLPNIPKLNQIVFSNVGIPSNQTQSDKAIKSNISGMKIALPLSTTPSVGGNIVGTPVLHLAPNIRQKFVHLSGIKIAQTPTVSFVTENKTTSTRVDNSTLEQLKEFDMVYEQVKVNSISNNFDNAAATPSTTIVTANPQPVVVVRNINPPLHNEEPLNRIQHHNRNKSLTTIVENNKKTVSTPPTKSPQKTHEDEETVQRIHNILAGYAEQIRNSPDLKNKPAPRKRSNLMSAMETNNSESTNSKSPNLKRKKISIKSESPISEYTNDDQLSLSPAPSTSLKIDNINLNANLKTSSNIIIPTTSSSQIIPRQLIITDPTYASQKNFTIPNNTTTQPKSLNYIVPINIVKIVSTTNGTKMISNTNNTQNNITQSNGNLNNSFVIQRFGSASNVPPILLRSQQTTKANPPVIVVTCNKPNNLVSSTNSSPNTLITKSLPASTQVTVTETSLTPEQPNEDYLILEEDEKSQFNDQFLSVHSKEDDKSIETTVTSTFSNPMTLSERKDIEQEYEDLGVDEPSTNDLFPEADIFFDMNNVTSNIIDSNTSTDLNKFEPLDSPDSTKLVVNKSAHYKNYSKPTEHRDKRKKSSPSFHRRLKFAKKTLKLELRKFNKTNDKDEIPPNTHIPIDLLSSNEQKSRTISTDKKTLFQQNQMGKAICLDNSIKSTQSSFYNRIDLIGSK